MKIKTLILCFCILLKFILQYTLINAGYDLHRDEYLHLDQAHHLAWGYLSVPPFTSWISYLILSLGNSVFWVKFFPALFGTLTLLLVWKSIEALGGGIFALLVGAFAIIFSAILRINTLFQPNSFDVLAWTAVYFFLLKYIITQKNQWLWYIVFIFSLGFLNKYNIVFMLIGLVPALLISEHRKVFLSTELYLAILMGFFLILPNLFWQYHHHFPVFYHLELLSKIQLVNINRIDFLKEQILFFFNSFFVLIIAFIAFFRYQPFKKFQVFVFAFVFTLLLFVYLKAKAYYAIGLYPIFFAFGAVYIEYLLKDSWKVYVRPLVLLLIVGLFIPVVKVAFPVLSPAEIEQKAQSFKDFDLLKWEDGENHTLPQDFADMLGWKELAQKVDKIYEQIPDKAHTLVLCDNYGQAGAINYYSRFKQIKAVTVNADYINWFPALDKVIIKNIILIQNADDDDKNREKERPLFEAVSLESKIDNHFAREYGTSIYYLKNAKVPINHFLKEDIEEEQKNWE